MQRRQKWGLGEGAHIWIPGPEPAFLPCECEELGSRERAVRRLLAPSCLTVTGPTVAGTWVGT